MLKRVTFLRTCHLVRKHLLPTQHLPPAAQKSNPLKCAQPPSPYEHVVCLACCSSPAVSTGAVAATAQQVERRDVVDAVVVKQRLTSRPP